MQVKENDVGGKVMWKGEWKGVRLSQIMRGLEARLSKGKNDLIYIFG